MHTDTLKQDYITYLRTRSDNDFNRIYPHLLKLINFALKSFKMLTRPEREELRQEILLKLIDPRGKEVIRAVKSLRNERESLQYKINSNKRKYQQNRERFIKGLNELAEPGELASAIRSKYIEYLESRDGSFYSFLVYVVQNYTRDLLKSERIRKEYEHNNINSSDYPQSEHIIGGQKVEPEPHEFTGVIDFEKISEEIKRFELCISESDIKEALKPAGLNFPVIKQADIIRLGNGFTFNPVINIKVSGGGQSAFTIRDNFLFINITPHEFFNGFDFGRRIYLREGSTEPGTVKDFLKDVYINRLLVCYRSYYPEMNTDIRRAIGIIGKSIHLDNGINIDIIEFLNRIKAGHIARTLPENRRDELTSAPKYLAVL